MAVRGHYDNDRYVWAIIIMRFYDNEGRRGIDDADLKKASAVEVTEFVVVELILDINPSELQGDVSEVDDERER
jgi:hypothetical protein